MPLCDLPAHLALGQAEVLGRHATHSLHHLLQRDLAQINKLSLLNQIADVESEQRVEIVEGFVQLERAPIARIGRVERAYLFDFYLLTSKFTPLVFTGSRSHRPCFPGFAAE